MTVNKTNFSLGLINSDIASRFRALKIMLEATEGHRCNNGDVLEMLINSSEKDVMIKYRKTATYQRLKSLEDEHFGETEAINVDFNEDDDNDLL